LRSHRDDIPLLTRHFLTELGKEKRVPQDFSGDAMDALCQYAWPGNVRQLKNATQSAVLSAFLNRHSQIELFDLPADILRGGRLPSPSPNEMAPSPIQSQINLDQELARAEFSLIERALVQSGGRKTEAWKLLGLNDRFALHRRAKVLFDRHPELIGDFPTVKQLYRRELK
jgi:DNA-binding NtrC family response regulator